MSIKKSNKKVQQGRKMQRKKPTISNKILTLIFYRKYRTLHIYPPTDAPTGGTYLTTGTSGSRVRIKTGRMKMSIINQKPSPHHREPYASYYIQTHPPSLFFSSDTYLSGNYLYLFQLFYFLFSLPIPIDLKHCSHPTFDLSTLFFIGPSFLKSRSGSILPELASSIPVRGSRK
jgi:hypothetical protein